MADAKTKDLLPCPFCGGPPQILSGGPGCHYIRCEGCSCTSDDRVRENAIAAWNRRAAPQPADVPHDVVRAAKAAYGEVWDNWPEAITAANADQVRTAAITAALAANPAPTLKWADMVREALATPAPSTSTEEALRAENARLWQAAEMLLWFRSRGKEAFADEAWEELRTALSALSR